MQPIPPSTSVNARLARDVAGDAAMDAVRLQCAAVAAQQVLLTEEESKLAERRAALDKQEEQLAAHLESRRLKLLQISECTQNERAVLKKERKAFEQHAVQRARELDERAARRHACEQALAQKQVRFHTMYELGRRRLREAWQELRQNQFRWKHRRGQERAALKLRQREIDGAANKLIEAQGLFLKDKRAWDSVRAGLQTEIDGLEARARNQRDKICQQQSAIAQLDRDRLARRQQNLAFSEPAANLLPLAPPATISMIPPEQSKETALACAPSQARCHDFEQLAGELTDQRMQLIEQWHRLSHVQARWERDRQQAALELETVARRLVGNAQLLSQREQLGLQADQVLRQRHDELVQIRQEMIAWRARLCVREKAWQGERQGLLANVQSREELADQHLGKLVDLRQRWAGRRRQELEKLREEQQAVEALRREHAQQRRLLMEQANAMEAERRMVAEKSLALEQYRKEFLAKVASPAAERRLERLRRRWLALNATAIRAAARERESAKAAFLTLEERVAELQKRADALAQAEVELNERQTSLEHNQTLAAVGQARVQHELHKALAQLSLSQQQVDRMKEEIERIARALIDEPDPPIQEALQAA